MDLFLLAAGAVVLIGITLWIVWPARTADAVGNSVHAEEVSEERPMAENATPTGLTPQGDRFEDQYTSATADLSAGGVAAAVEAMQAEGGEPQSAPRAAYGTPVRPTVAATTLSTPPPTPIGPTVPSRTMGLGAGALLALSGGVGGAWIYARWQRKRNKPINRLRRGAREMAGRLGERIPDVDELPRGAAPMSGAATALLLAALVASRALRHDRDDPTAEARERAEEILRESVQDALVRGRGAAKRGRKQSDELLSRVQEVDSARRPLIMRIGLGGMALIGGGAFVIWRILRRGGPPDRSTWYAGE